MRILLAAEGTRGDIYPLRALGEAWLRAGHEVTLCAPPDFEDPVRERGLAFRAVGRDVRAYMSEVAAAVAGGSLSTLRELTRYLAECLRAQLAGVPAAAVGADLVIGAGVQAGAAVAAEIHGIPYRYVVYCPVLFPSREYAPMVLPTSGLSPRGNRIAWALTQPLFVGIMRRALNRERQALGLAPVRDVFRFLVSERPILAADRDLAPVPADHPLPIQQIRGLHPLERTPLPEKLQRFLAAGPPPVFLGFGSMPDPEPVATTRAVLDAVERSGCRAVISRGWAGLGEGPLPANVFVTGAVSHAELFPRCALVVHHGGAGTTTSAARAGVPQLLVPHLLDQFYWAGRVQALGLGPPCLRRTRLAAGPLAERIAACLDNELLAERTAAFAQRLAALGPVEPDVQKLL